MGRLGCSKGIGRVQGGTRVPPDHAGGGGNGGLYSGCLLWRRGNEGRRQSAECRKPPNATSKPPQSLLIAKGLGPQTHLKATLKPPQCDPHATLKPPAGQAAAREGGPVRWWSGSRAWRGSSRPECLPICFCILPSPVNFWPCPSYLKSKYWCGIWSRSKKDKPFALSACI